jgi:hypothetical protein
MSTSGPDGRTWGASAREEPTDLGGHHYAPQLARDCERRANRAWAWLASVRQTGRREATMIGWLAWPKPATPLPAVGLNTAPRGATISYASGRVLRS